jgi:hypothetical protein
VFAGLLHFWRHRETAGAVLGVLGAVLTLSAFVAPTHLGPVQRGWMGLAKAISKVTTPIVMGVIFFLVITPIGFAMRRFGRRRLVHQVRDGGFWMPPASGGRSDLERQF